MADAKKALADAKAGVKVDGGQRGATPLASLAATLVAAAMVALTAAR